MSKEFHLEELRIALDPKHPANIQPPPMPDGARILDIGCGAGQTLIGAYPQRLTFGIDIDLSALALGRTLTNDVQFACGNAEMLPFTDKQFDLVVARVSLPYTRLSRSLAEIRRVLKPNGVVWMVLHPFSFAWRELNAGSWKSWVFFGYKAVNSALFHFTSEEFRFVGRCETFQTPSGITRALRKLAFVQIAIENGPPFVVTAKRTE
jgi:ubiquinone/menaquinone biosynthesis C-methylase UbiE